MKDPLQIESQNFSLLKTEIEKFNKIVEEMKIPKKYKIKVVVISAALIVINYLVFGFINLNFDVSSWSAELRFFFVVISLIICALIWFLIYSEFDDHSSAVKQLIRTRKDYSTMDIINFLKKHCSEENYSNEDIWNKILDILNNNGNENETYKQKDKDIARFIVYNFNTKII